MAGIRQWVREHTFETYLIALFLMAVPPIPLYFAANRGADGLVWMLLGLVVLGNLIVLSVRGNG